MQNGAETNSSPKKGKILDCYLTTVSPKGGSMAFAPAARHCSMFCRMFATMSDVVALLSLKIRLFISHQISHVIAMISVLTPLLSSLLAFVTMVLTIAAVVVTSPGGNLMALQCLHVVATSQIDLENGQFQNK